MYNAGKCELAMSISVVFNWSLEQTIFGSKIGAEKLRIFQNAERNLFPFISKWGFFWSYFYITMQLNENGFKGSPA